MGKNMFKDFRIFFINNEVSIHIAAVVNMCQLSLKVNYSYQFHWTH